MSEKSTPKTTRADSDKQRPKAVKTAKKRSRRYDSFPDKIDVRDWLYQPTLQALPDQLINCDKVPTVLDQGEEGACTGFALAAVINYHLHQNKRIRKTQFDKQGASPRMLYEMARRYDEWPGENYEGSSARGTMKGWVAHGVVSNSLWTAELHGPQHLDDEMAKAATAIPAGAYYRVMHKQIRDMHAALNETGILFATIMTHEGWDSFDKKDAIPYSYNNAGKKDTIILPVIKRKGRAAWGHAVAICGYTKEGFIIQNSWGDRWGNGGFALLPYEDWVLHAMDCWVAQLGVPIATNLWENGYADSTAGRQRATSVIPLAAIRPYTINIGNNGNLSDSGKYWTTPADIERMFTNIAEKTAGWKKKRIMLYLHGGLNNEKVVAKRIVTHKGVCLKNQVYPVHIMWETGVIESLRSSVFDVFTDDDKAAGSWLRKLREGTLEIKDRTFELTTARAGKLLWNEMKENARLASERKGAAMDIVVHAAKQFMQGLTAKEMNEWELHIVAHSAGSIFAAYAMEKLLETGIPIKSIHFMAPAITIELFKSRMLDSIEKLRYPKPTLYLLSDVGERDDNVAIYGKSLLYLVSNAFEERRETPLLGMEKFIRPVQGDGSYADAVLKKMYANKDAKMKDLVIAGEAPSGVTVGPDVCRSDSHGGFDEDPYTLNSVLFRILGKRPERPFTVRDLQFDKDGDWSREL